MNALGDKLNSVTGQVVFNSVNKLKKKQNKGSSDDQQQHDETPDDSIQPTRAATDLNIQARDLNQGFAFGSDSTRVVQKPPPPIGWRPDLAGPAEPITSSPIAQPNYRSNASSSESLYQGDTWSKLWFQRVMIITLIRLIVFIRKIYEDYKATQTYGSLQGYVGQFIISALTLLLPTAVFTIYRVSRYLQIALPSSRITHHSNSNSPSTSQQTDSGILDKTRSTSPPVTTETASQETRALLNSPNLQRLDEDGYDTARQTPVGPEDSETPVTKEKGSQLSPTSPQNAGEQLQAATCSKQLSTQIENFKETVNIDKLGNLPDKENTRIVIGASEQLLHGLLYIFWQLKRQVDVLSYLVDRACLWRKPSEREKEELNRLQIGSDGLEWFQDFYAAFLAILTQLYTLGFNWSYVSGVRPTSPVSNSTPIYLSSVAPGVSAGNERMTHSSPVFTTSDSSQKDTLIFSELVISLLVISSLLVAVRRRDDGPLTLTLSTLGWGSLFASRIIIISLAFVHIGVKIMIGAILIHIIGMTLWIYKISLDSHNGKKDESDDWQWTIEDGQPSREIEESVEMKTKRDEKDPNRVNNQLKATDQWTVLEHMVLLTQILSLFAVPSLFYWPIMFNLKMHARPFKYLVLILSENFLLIPTVWYAIADTSITWPWYLMIIVGASSISGFLFISMYICCKPSLTEYFARADQLFNEAERSGIYFEFCSRVFKMPDLSKNSFTRLLNQTQKTVDVVELEIERPEEKV